MTMMTPRNAIRINVMTEPGFLMTVPSSNSNSINIMIDSVAKITDTMLAETSDRP